MVSEYDPLGRVIKVTNIDGSSVTSSYYGYAKTITNESGVKKIFENDAYGNLIKTTEFNDSNNTPYSNIQYEYNVALNSLLKTTDQKGNTTTMTYDGFGRKIAMNDPDLGRWKYKYDLNGNLIEQTDNKNQTMKFEYDALNRLTNKIYPNQTKDSYTYDEGNYAKGKITRKVDLSGSTQAEYDVRGRVVKEIKNIVINNQTNSFTTYYTYDALDRVKTVKYPDNEEVQFFYDRAGSSSSLKITNGPTLVTNTTYNALGMIKKQDYGNNTSSEYTYNDSLRLNSIKTSNLFHKKYSYDLVGNIIKIEDMINPSETENYAYDNLNRLLSANGPYDAKYEYNEIGNILFKKEGADTRTLTYSNQSPVHAPKAVNNVSYQYDANGNLTKDERREITYDYENRPTSMILGEQNTQTPAPTSLASLPPSGSTPQPTTTATNPPSASVSLNKGVNKISWTSGYPQNKQFSGLPDNCSAISERENNFWSVYVKNYNQGQDNFLANHQYYIRCKDNATISSSLFSFPQALAQTASNQPVKVDFVYDGSGSRVAKIEGTSITLYIGDFEKNLQTGEVTKYYSFGGKRIAIKVKDTLSFIISDHLGSLRKTTDSSSIVKSEANYYPYGRIRNQNNLNFSRLYTGQVFDDKTDLYFYKTRYYNPDSGKFLQPDVAVDVTSSRKNNRYQYANSNPIVFNDPSGMEGEDSTGGTGTDCVSNPLSLSCLSVSISYPETPIQATQALNVKNCYSEEECKANEELAEFEFKALLIMAGLAMGGGLVAEVIIPAIMISPAVATTIGTTAGSGAAVLRQVGQAYTSQGGQRLIFDFSDPRLMNFLQKGGQYINQLRTSLNISRVPLANQYVNQAVRYSTEAQQAVYTKSGGVARLGDFCAVGVCREKAALLHSLLANMGKSSEMVVAEINGGRHAFVEFVDSATKIKMVADPTNGIIQTATDYYSNFGVIVSTVQRYVFVKPGP